MIRCLWLQPTSAATRLIGTLPPVASRYCQARRTSGAGRGPCVEAGEQQPVDDLEPSAPRRLLAQLLDQPGSGRADHVGELHDLPGHLVHRHPEQRVGAQGAQEHPQVRRRAGAVEHGVLGERAHHERRRAVLRVADLHDQPHRGGGREDDVARPARLVETRRTPGPAATAAATTARPPSAAAAPARVSLRDPPDRSSAATVAAGSARAGYRHGSITQPTIPSRTAARCICTATTARSSSSSRAPCGSSSELLNVQVGVRAGPGAPGWPFARRARRSRPVS